MTRWCHVDPRWSSVIDRCLLTEELRVLIVVRSRSKCQRQRPDPAKRDLWLFYYVLRTAYCGCFFTVVFW